MRRTVFRVLIFSAALSGFAAFAAPTVFAAQTPAESRSLRDCGTEVQGSAGTGWCSGTGSFRVKVDCADGESVLSSRAIINSGYVQMSLSCSKSAARSAQIVVLDNPL